jgi:hypothetical protein
VSVPYDKSTYMYVRGCVCTCVVYKYLFIYFVLSYPTLLRYFSNIIKIYYLYIGKKRVVHDLVYTCACAFMAVMMMQSVDARYTLLCLSIVQWSSIALSTCVHIIFLIIVPRQEFRKSLIGNK